jgi:hypothetical protein
VSRRSGSDLEASLDLVKVLGGNGNAAEVYRRVNQQADTGVVVWDQMQGGAHTALVGYVLPRQIAVLVTTSAFCSRAVPLDTSAARQFADFVVAIGDSYQGAG